MAREEGLSAQFASDSETIRTIYDEWSSTYDVDTTSWGYEAPRVAAGLLAARVDPEGQILDVGCGSGKVGQALNALGHHDIVGVDVSSALLDIAAASGSYRALAEVDFTTLPTSLLEGSFGGLICVGVMTYLPEVEAVCREFARLVEPGGALVVTQRTDLFDSRDTQAAFDALAADGIWKIEEVTSALPYLPGHAEYEGIDVRYGVFSRL